MTAAPAPISIADARGATLRFTGHAARPEGQDWVPLPEAARILGRSEGALRRDCVGLERRNLAKKMRVPGSRNETWCIHITYDRRLLTVEPPAPQPDHDRVAGEELTPEQLLAAATEQRRREASLKAQAVKLFRDFRADPSKHSKRDLPALRVLVRERTGIMPSRSQLYAWDAACPPTTDDPSRDATLFAAALLDGRAGRSGGGPRGKGVSIAHPEAWSAFESLYLDPRQPSIAYCHRRVAALAAEKGWAWPSERRVAQLVAERIEPSRACLAREGLHAWERKFQHTMQQHKDSWAPMERWDADHARLDFFVRVARGGREGGHFVAARPWVSLWLDWRTRTVVGYHLSLQPNATTIQLALLDGIRRMGCAIPAIAWIDNGKDFQAAALHGLSKRERHKRRDEARQLGGAFEWTKEHAVGILGRLGIEPHFARPYNHNGKARIERFFRTLHEDFDRSIDSYCGGDPGMVSEEHRKALLDRPEALPTLGEVRPLLDRWIAAYNATPRKGMDDLRDESTGELLAPLAYLDRYPFHTRTVADADAIALLEQRFTRPLTVGKLGIGVTIAGRKVYFGAREPALERFKGSGEASVVVTYDPADTTQVRVYDTSMRFLCVARENEQFGQGVSEEARREAHAARREQRREAKRRPDRAAALMTDAELALRMQRERDVKETQAEIRRAAPEVKEVPALRLVRTGLEGQRERIEREELRQAAGAEHAAVEHFRPNAAIDQIIDATPRVSVGDDGDALDINAIFGGHRAGDDDGYVSIGEVLR